MLSLTNDGSLLILGFNSLVVGSAVLIAHSVFVLVRLRGKIFNGLAVSWHWGWSIGTDWRSIVGNGESNGSADKGQNHKALKISLFISIINPTEVCFHSFSDFRC